MTDPHRIGCIKPFGAAPGFGALRRAALCVLVAVAPVGGLAAQTSRQDVPLTMIEAVRSAVGWHPAVSEATNRLNQGKEGVKAARSAYGPQLSIGLGSDFDDPAGAGIRPRATVSASQMLYDFGKVSSAVASARATQAIDHAELLDTIDTLARDTSYAVIEVQRAVALRHEALDQLKSVKTISNLVKERYEAGAATKSDALQAQSRVEAAEGTIAKMTAQRERWRATLAHLLGKPDVGAVDASAPPWLAQACAVRNVDWDRVPAIMKVEAQQDQAEAELDHARAGRLPTVALGAGTSADVGAPFSHRTRYSLGINVSTDLYGSRVTRSQTRAAEYALQASNAAMMSVRNDVLTSTAEAERQVDSLRRVLDILRARQSSMTETDQLYRLQYLQMGTRTLVDLLNAVQELHQSNFDMVNVAHDLRKLEVDCLYSTGRLREAFGLDDAIAREERS